MKTTLWKTLLLALLFATGAAQAQSVVVDFTGTISYVDDPYGVVPEIVLGDTLVGQYTYETNSYDLEPMPEVGYYLHLGGSGILTISAGPYQVVTDTSGSNPYHILIDDEQAPGLEYFSVHSGELVPNNGASFDYALLTMSAMNNSALASDDLTATPPDPALFNQGIFVEFSGTKNGHFFYVKANIGDPSTPAASARHSYLANAVVTSIYDPMGTLAGKVSVNDSVTTVFAFDQSTLNASSVPEQGSYQHLPGTGVVVAEFPNVLFETDVMAQTPTVNIYNGSDTFSPDYVSVAGGYVMSSDPSLSVMQVEVRFDGDFTAINSVDLPADTLSLGSWQTAAVYIQGVDWYIQANISNLEYLPTTAVFPTNGLVHPMQQFDMSIRVNDRPTVVGIQGSNNSVDISSYLSSCLIMPPIGFRQSIVCPSTTSALTAGNNTLELQLMLDDGSSLQAQAQWEVRD